MDLDHRRAQFGRRLDLRPRRPDEQGNANARVLEIMHHRRELCTLPDGIESAFGGTLRASFRHKTDGVRPGLECDADHLRGRRHLEIERLVDLRFEADDVIIADMTAILAQMRGDAVAAGGDCKFSRSHRIGMASTAGIADGSDMVDVDAEAEAVHALPYA